MDEKEEKKIYSQIQEVLICSKFDPILFIQSFCKLKDQAIGAPIPFSLWDCQKEQLQDWVENKESITLKTRQCGISWLSGAFALWRSFFNEYFYSMVVSKKEDEAVEYLSRVKFMYDHLPPIIQALHPLKTATRLRLEFENGANIIAESSNPQAGRGRTLNLLILDEAAFIPEARSIDTAATPTLQKTNGSKIIISTANGYDSYFQPKWNAAINNLTSVKPNFIAWNADPTRDEIWWNKGYEDAIAEEKGQEWLQEHPRNYIEAFIVSGRTVFDPELLMDISNEIEKRNVPIQKYMFGAKEKLLKESNGKLHIFEHPKRGFDYVIGSDVAEGLSTGDFSTAVVYCRNEINNTYKQVAEYQDQIDTDSFGKLLNKLGKYYNTAMINLEMNSYGDSVMNTLQKQLHYPKYYHQMRYDQTSKRKIKKIGWKTTVTSKPVLIDTLKAMMRDRTMQINSLKSVGEMKTFVRHDAGYSSKMGASYGSNDDLVIAQALCAIVLLEKPVIQKMKHAKPYRWHAGAKRTTLNRAKVFK